ncbi:hypothetical protein XA68_13663 [Ophiocordyceps unilateralis]|uniref:Uncharacterized protein n=1 Tax=Ophiocordyceps unilateralis TaxID=268505 RepID=A0A2A9PC03_OPHUN|nr:hypothetical protein XA68_13663 [Ophiocordyceps unilateralis]
MTDSNRNCAAENFLPLLPPTFIFSPSDHRYSAKRLLIFARVLWLTMPVSLDRAEAVVRRDSVGFNPQIAYTSPLSMRKRTTNMDGSELFWVP